MTAAPMNQFMTDEYVLAYHGPLLYEARVSHSFNIISRRLSCFGWSLEIGWGKERFSELIIDLIGRELD